MLIIVFFTMESGNDIGMDETHTKIEVEKECCLPEGTSTEMKSKSEVSHNSDVGVANGPLSFSSVFSRRSDSDIRGDDHEIDSIVKVKEEPMDSEVTSTETKSKSEVSSNSDVDITSESPSFASVFITQSIPEIHVDDREIDTTVMIKEEPVDSEATSTEVTCDSDAHTQSESSSVASDFITQYGSNICREYSGIDVKIEIKEEPEWKCTSEDTELKDAYFNSKHKLSAGDGEFILPESPRLDADGTWTLASGTNNSGVDKGYLDYLKLRENTNNGKYNTTAAHRNDVDDKMPHKCEFCGDYFTTILCLQTHIVTHLARRKHRCNICDKSFTQAGHLKTHYLMHEGKRPFKCSMCDRSFTQASHLKTHNFIHEGKMPHKCKVCRKSFTHPSRLKAHYLIHEGERPHKCELCKRAFKRAFDLKKHYLIHESKGEFKSNKCDKGFNSASKLKTDDFTMLYKCVICEKSFSFPSHLRQHNVIHEGKRSHKCEICEKAFMRASDLKKHNLIHEGKRPFKCEVCEKTFRKSSHMKRHVLIHEGKKPHKCDVCEMSFLHASRLKEHSLIHLGRRPHKCEKCEKSFIKLSNLKTHILIHEGKRPHVCEICGKSFTLAPYLKEHKLLHGGEGSHKCEICGKSFSRASRLKQHSFTHGDKSHMKQVSEDLQIEVKIEDII